MSVALITGITGQTGSYLSEQLVESGWDVHGITNGGIGNPLPESVHLHSLDLRDHGGVSTLISGLEPDLVVNLAAISSVALSWKEPEATAEINGSAVATLLNACLKLSDIKNTHFVQASSAEIFAGTSEVPQTENTALHPTNPYGASKAYAHLLVGTYRSAGLRASSCILYNHESPRRPETFVTRKITSSVARISRGLQDKLVLGNLEVKRDWGWAPDYAQAIAKIGQAQVADDYIVATGISHTIKEFVEAAFHSVGITEWEHLVTSDPAFIRPTDSAELRGDASKIRSILGWEPQVSFNEIVSSMVENDLMLLG